MSCPSVNVTVESSYLLNRQQCRLPAGHTGQCTDGHGHRWTRVAEWRRLEREKATA